MHSAAQILSKDAGEMRIRLNSFIEEMVRRVDRVICRQHPALEQVPRPQRIFIVARQLVEKGYAEKRRGPDDVDLWVPCASQEQRMGSSNIAEPIELEIKSDFPDRRKVLLYVAAVHEKAAEILPSAIERAVANIIAFNKGYASTVGWDKDGSRKWKQTALGRRKDPIW
jgi:hypothetical protein